MTLNFGRLLLLFTIVPFIELYLLLQLAAATSSAVTFALIITTGVVGAAIARHQGKKVLVDIQKEMHLGRLPGDHLVHGLCVLIGGVLLLTPGLLTDAVGFLLLIPISRLVIVKLVKRKFSGVLQRQTVQFYNVHARPEDHYETYEEE